MNATGMNAKQHFFCKKFIAALQKLHKFMELALTSELVYTIIAKQKERKNSYCELKLQYERPNKR